MNAPEEIKQLQAEVVTMTNKYSEAVTQRDQFARELDEAHRECKRMFGMIESLIRILDR